MTGLFVSRRATLQIPAGGLVMRMGEGGAPASSATLHVHYDVCPIWIALARQHLADAVARQIERVAAWKAADDDAKVMTLEREFESSMQAIVACAIAVDAFYATVRKNVNVPAKTEAAWAANRIGRHARIVDVFRMAFRLNNKAVGVLRTNLEQIYRFRNLAVHPSGAFTAPDLHPELNVHLEQRFVLFRCSNAQMIVFETARLLMELVVLGRPKNTGVRAYAESLRRRLEESGITAIAPQK